MRRRRPIAMLGALHDLALDMIASPPPPILLILLGPLILPLILLELWHRTSRTAAAKSQASYSPYELGVITLGDYCTVSGLTQYGDRNGKRARVVGRDAKKGLWHVIIDGEAQAQDSPSKNGKVALRPENLVPDVPSLQPATVLSAKIRRGELTSRALTELCVQQLLRADESLNALTAHRFEDALKEADAADAAVAAGRAPPVSIAPLWGVPILVKECFEIAGLPFTAGVASLTGRVGLTTAPSMTRLAEAGLPILGSTNVSEACMFHEAANPSRRLSSNSPPLRPRPAPLCLSAHKSCAFDPRLASLRAECQPAWWRHAYTGRLEWRRRGPRGGSWRSPRGYVRRRRLDSNPLALLRPFWT